ncbi:unnamed protein product [Ceratitis capitata]|uniref:(Mediterranean fruit fly) hypothetical protein n=1 Tax=Ceratitis capitata TaxID=7213 RepID=A0A811U379_CERCA|nr:unnamed protein product [Ceratitis capitata]
MGFAPPNLITAIDDKRGSHTGDTHGHCDIKNFIRKRSDTNYAQHMVPMMLPFSLVGFGGAMSNHEVSTINARSPAINTALWKR